MYLIVTIIIDELKNYYVVIKMLPIKINCPFCIIHKPLKLE